ncbi:hypothetical protein Misp01_56260 [Microtetraspora sp. NBRC 13810]|nr:hypothetical protein Misp01_56260 [Microtetraspora sp. NBRC 13810]
MNGMSDSNAEGLDPTQWLKYALGREWFTLGDSENRVREQVGRLGGGVGVR